MKSLELLETPTYLIDSILSLDKVSLSYSVTLNVLSEFTIDLSTVLYKKLKTSISYVRELDFFNWFKPH